MTDFPSYSLGTVSVSNGDTAIVGDGTIWTGVNARAGDTIVISTDSAKIVDVTDDTHLKIDTWPFTTVASGTSYKIIQDSPLRFVGGQAMADVSFLISVLNSKGLLWYLPAGYTDPNDVVPALTADDGQGILKIDTGALWVMSGGSWVAAGTFKGISFKGAYDSGTAYNVNDVVTSDGNAYIVTAATTGHEPPNASYYSLLASKGDQGVKGDTGTAATIAVGTVTTGAAGSDATVTNSGTTSAATFDFTIPKGDQGIQGVQGLQGTGIQPDATGDAADKTSHDAEAKGFVFLETDVAPFELWVKASATSGDWDGPTYVTGNVPLGDLGSVADSIEQSFDLGSVA